MEGCHQFLELVPKEMKKWVVIKKEEQEDGCPEEKKLELRLGPPSGDWSMIHESVTKDPSQPCNHRAAPNSNVTATTTAHKRTAPGPVAGWPPVRSFRKNLATGNSSNSYNSSKLPSESTDKNNSDQKPVQKSQFVKINMDGIPIGRKVDLKAFDSYEKLSYAVDELFQGLIAVQRDTPGSGIEEERHGKDKMGRLVKENGEYTLVYEDNEGDRMLVGDVPWNMFVSTVKRLRVLRSSEISALSHELSLRRGK